MHFIIAIPVLVTIVIGAEIEGYFYVDIAICNSKWNPMSPLLDIRLIQDEDDIMRTVDKKN